MLRMQMLGSDQFINQHDLRNCCQLPPPDATTIEDMNIPAGALRSVIVVTKHNSDCCHTMDPGDW